MARQRHWALVFYTFTAVACGKHLSGPSGNTTPDCSKVCSRFGQCAVVEGACVAADDRSCRESDVCRLFGDCLVEEGRCVPTADGCADSVACAEHRLCALRTYEGRQVCARGDAGCSKTQCKESGRCASNGLECVARVDADCRQSTYCKVSGLCKKVDEYCGAGSHRDCRESRECRTQGRCASDGHFECLPGSSEDCARSDQCKTSGLCVFEGGKCVATSEAHCRGSSACIEQGACHPVGKVCAAASLDDCRSATRCKGLGGCSFRQGMCLGVFAPMDG